MTAFKDRSDRFLSWLIENGAIISGKVCLAEIEGMGTGLLAVENIEAGHVLFTIPKTLLLSRHYSPSIKALVKNRQWNQLIWTIIVERRKKDSFFTPYFEMIPQDVNTARSWSEEDKEWLRGTDIYEDISNINPFDDFCKSSKVILNNGVNLPTTEEFYFAADLISSYSFTEPESGEVLMIPMADMLNHSFANNAHCKYLNGGGMSMEAIKTIKKGEQIYNTFGVTSNSQLLLKYGFIELPNPMSFMTIYGYEIEQYLEECIEYKEMKRAYKYLKSEYEVSVEGSELDKLFGKLNIPISGFYKWRFEQLPELHSIPANSRQKLALQLVQEQQSILSKRIGNIVQS